MKMIPKYEKLFDDEVKAFIGISESFAAKSVSFSVSSGSWIDEADPKDEQPKCYKCNLNQNKGGSLARLILI